MSRVILSFVIIACIFSLVPSTVGARALYQDQAASTPEDGIAPDKAVPVFAPPRMFTVMHSGQIGATVTNYGTFGTGFVSQPVCDGDPCPSFESPEESDLEYLFGGAIWIGGIVGGDTLVSVAADGWYSGVYELVPPVPLESFGGAGDQSVWMLFTDTITDASITGVDNFDDRYHIPLHVRIANRAYAWNTDPENQMIIYDMVITNIGDQTIEDGYVAFFFDADIYHTSNATGFFDDLTGSIRDAGIGYAIDNNGDPEDGSFFTAENPTRMFAFKPLTASFTITDTGYNWWVSHGNPDYDYGPQPVDEFGDPQCDFGGHIGTPTGDAAKYCMMSHPGWAFDQFYTADSISGWTYPYNPAQAADFADGTDTRFLMSLGSFTLLPDSSVRILYTTFTGDSVIHVPDNLANLPDNPDQYLANLDFSHVLANAAVADSLAESLIDPLNKVTGLYVLHNDLDSVVVTWDPWVFPDLDGCDIYLYEIPADSLPYPGIAPPWIHPSVVDLAASLGRTDRYAFSDLEPWSIYTAAVANRMDSRGVGEMSESVAIMPGGRPPAPEVASHLVFIHNGETATFEWTPPENLDVDHYNIYRFTGSQEAASKYHALYDTGEFASQVAPRDSFNIDGVWYYYYAMEPYASVGSGTTTFSESVADSSFYAVTAATSYGTETAFSEDIAVYEIPLRTRDILVVACGSSTEIAICDSIFDYYGDVLAGYDFEFYNWDDTAQLYNCKPGWWYDLMPYSMVIVDGGWSFDILGNRYCSTLPGLENYAGSGGLIAYFGSFNNLTNVRFISPPGYYPAPDGVFVDEFGLDSLFAIGPSYYIPYYPSKRDTLGGFIRAESMDNAVPEINYDSSLHPYTAYRPWPAGVAPLAGAFFNNEDAVPILAYRSLYPLSSMAEGLPVGIQSTGFAGPVYSFAFRPWFMQREDMTVLIDYLMSQTAEVASARSIIEPDTMKFYWAYALEPMTATIFIGGFPDKYAVGDLDASSVQINGGVLPTDVSAIDVHPDFDGPVLAITISMPDFLISYGPLWGRKKHPYAVSAAMSDGTRFLTTGNVFIKGFLGGDADGNGRINIADATYLVNYIFRDGEAPVVMALGDANGDCDLDIGDAIYLINYIFRSGPEPRPGCAE